MDISSIIGLCVALPSLIALFILLFYICIRLTNTEKKERETRTKLYNELIKYFKKKNE